MLDAQNETQSYPSKTKKHDFSLSQTSPTPSRTKTSIRFSVCLV